MMSSVEKRKLAALHSSLCERLDVDNLTKLMSWNNFVAVQSNFTLEGDCNHWFCCSLYAADRMAHLPIGRGKSAAQGNFASVTRLLFLSEISIKEFFNNIKRWIKMANFSILALLEVGRLERILEVSFGLYEKYNDIFDQLFIGRLMINCTESSPMECTVQNLHEFCWCLFLCVKEEEAGSNTNTVVSLNLLLCVFEFVYTNALDDLRFDMLNASFTDLRQNWCTSDDSDSDDSPATQTPFSIFDKLCEMFSLDTTFAKYVKKHYFTEIIQKFFRNKILFGNCRDFLKIISTKFFASNVRALNKFYDHQILATGEFDERILLGYFRFTQDDDPAEHESVDQYLNRYYCRTLKIGTLVNEQPLLPWENISLLVTIAMRNAKDVNLLVQRICSKISTRKIMNEDMIVQLEKLLDEMCAVFCQKYPIKSEAKEKFDLAKPLYYFLLDKIMQMEQRNKPNIDVKWIFEEEIIHRTLITCCLEIILLSTGSELKFPWILECFNVQAFYFVKIIEMIMSHHDGFLSIFVLIHLRIIAEKCLDSLAWCSNSTLWEIIAHCNDWMPSWTDVVLQTAGAKKPDKTVQETNANENSADARFTPNSGESAKRELIAPSETNSATTTSTGGASARSSTSKGENAVAKPTETSSEPDERKLTHSLLLFCRKFYELAFGRMLELCHQLGLMDDSCIEGIWTMFRDVMIKNTKVMQDRHLDQIIMCSIYVIIKGFDIPSILFPDIAECYMNQPHATSTVYTDVLMQPAVKDSDGNEICPPRYSDIGDFYSIIYYNLES